MKWLVLVISTLLVAPVATPAPDVTAGQVRPPVGPEALEALGELIVGTWEADDSRHVHEWGVGHRLIRSRSYAPAENGWTPVSEGIWYWDGEAETLRAVVLAVGMPMDRAEYRSEVEGDRVVHEVRTFGEVAGRFFETWTFGDEAYRWRLEQRGEEGLIEVMGGAYRRVAADGNVP